jgi:Uma2 family endonuclease
MAEMAVTPGLMTADDLLRLPDDGMRHELVRGALRTMAPPGWQHGDLTSVIDGSLGPYARRLRLGRVVTNDAGFLLTSDPDTVRGADLAFVRRERLEALGELRGFFPGAPDLAIEVISPSDLYTEVDEKVAEWLEYGTVVVFVVNPRRRSVAVHRLGQPVSILSLGDALSAEDVVPGWSLPMQELFD